MSSSEEELLVFSSDDEAHAKIWDIRDTETDEEAIDETNPNILSSDDPNLTYEDGTLLGLGMSSTAENRTRRRSSFHEALWESWKESLNSSTKLNQLSVQMSSIEKTRQSFKRSKTVNEDKKQIIRKSINNEIPDTLLNQLAEDSFDTTKDWYFLTTNPDMTLIPDPYLMFLGTKQEYELRDLYYRLGADLSKDLELSYCPYGKLLPVEVMCDLIRTNNCDTVESFEFFIKYILDRQVSVHLDRRWVADMWNSFSCPKLLSLLELIPLKCYLMYYRLTRLLPIQNELVSLLFPNESSIIKEFERLLDSKEWSSLLYFVLLVLGSKALPFGYSKRMSYIKDCITDLNAQNSSMIQLSILKTYVTVCSKIMQH